MSMILVWKMGIVFGILSEIIFNGDGGSGGVDLLIIFVVVRGSAHDQTDKLNQREAYDVSQESIDENVSGIATPELEMIIRNS